MLIDCMHKAITNAHSTFLKNQQKISEWNKNFFECHKVQRNRNSVK